MSEDHSRQGRWHFNWIRLLAILGIASAAINMIVVWIFMFQQADPRYGHEVLAQARKLDQSSVTTQDLNQRKLEVLERHLNNQNLSQDAYNALIREISGLSTKNQDDGIIKLAGEAMPKFFSMSMADSRVSFIKCGIAFVLMSLGFSFYMIGYEAVRTRDETIVQTPWLLFKTTSPGIICLVCGSLVLIIPGMVFGSAITGPLGSKDDLIAAQAEVELAKARYWDARADALTDPYLGEQALREREMTLKEELAGSN